MSAVVAVSKEKLDNPPLEIHHLGDKALRQPAKRIAKVDDGIRDLAMKMLQTMYSANGIGLAAPQVAINKQIIVIDCEPDNPDHEPLVLINPEITKFGSELSQFEEGCLSIPGVYLDVERPEAIEVKFKDTNGKPKKIKASGLLSRVIQHEIDHLKGVMFVDRVDNELALNEALNEKGFSLKSVQKVKS